MNILYKWGHKENTFVLNIKSDQIFIDIYISLQVSQAEINKHLLVPDYVSCSKGGNFSQQIREAKQPGELEFSACLPGDHLPSPCLSCLY